MACSHWLLVHLVGLLCAVWPHASVAHASQRVETEQCAFDVGSDSEDSHGHALLATRAKRKKVDAAEESVWAAAEVSCMDLTGDYTLTSPSTGTMTMTMTQDGCKGSSTANFWYTVAGGTITTSDGHGGNIQDTGSITILLDNGFTATGQANITAEQRDMLKLALAQRKQDSTHELSKSVSAQSELLDGREAHPFKGSSNPLLDRERHDADYIRDGNETVPNTSLADKINISVEVPGGEPVDKKHVLAAYVVAPLAFVFFCAFTISTLMEKKEITAIPESGLMIVIGAILGLFMQRLAEFEMNDETWSEMMICILNLILLPIIIFESGWAIRRQDFYSQFPYILLFALVGVALSTVVIAMLIYWTGYMEFHSVTGLRTAFAYASLISATDPVATLSTYSKLKVEPLLNIMVFGESTINDAVAIVLFNVFNSDHFMMNEKGSHLAGWELLMSINWGVVKILSGSVFLGGLFGCGFSLVANWADMRHNKKGQILVIFACAYLTFATAESVGMSGIIAVMFCGVLMGIYMRPHLSSEGSLLATFFLRQCATLADASVFLLVGFSVMSLTTRGWYFSLWVMLFCLIGRAVSVFPVAILVNILKASIGMASGVPEEGWNKLSPKHMFMMWHAGLRGAIALALALELGEWVDIVDGAGTKRALQTATFLVIVAFLLVFGGTTSASLKYMGIDIGVEAPPDALSKTEDMGPARSWLKYLDERILSPWLIGQDNYEHRETEKDVEDLLKNVHRW